MYIKGHSKKEQNLLQHLVIKNIFGTDGDLLLLSAWTVG